MQFRYKLNDGNEKTFDYPHDFDAEEDSKKDFVQAVVEEMCRQYSNKLLESGTVCYPAKWPITIELWYKTKHLGIWDVEQVCEPKHTATRRT